MSLAAALRTGDDLRRDGRHQEAADVYRRLLSESPHDAGLAHRLAEALGAMGEHQAALAVLDEALSADDRPADPLFLRAETLRRLGRLEEAVAGFDRLLSAYPRHSAGHHLRGVTLAALGRPAEAVESYDAAVRLDPFTAKVFNNRGTALEAMGRLAEALADYEEALRLQSGYALALHNRGSALHRLGRIDEALSSFAEALASRPDIPETWNFQAVALATLGRHHEALASCDQAIALRPPFPEAWNNRSIALRALRRPLEALESARRALALRPLFAEAHNSLGAALSALERYEEAASSFRQALALNPKDGGAHLNLGMALDVLEDLDGAIAHFDAAHALDPEAPEPIYSSGLAYIRRGDLAEGFKRFEVRWSQKDGPTLRYPRASLWLGQTGVAGRKLLVHAEQGFGDVIQFCRFAPLLADRGAEVWMETQPALAPLLSSLRGVRDVRPFGAVAPVFDLHTPVMSLVLALGLTLEELSPQSPYLAPPEPRRRLWRDRLEREDRPRIGLAWSGNPKHYNDANRTMALSCLAPLFELDAEFVSLQREHRQDDLQTLAALPIRRLDSWLADFADTAAAIELCDLVISVDTSVAHLAGALGAPTLLLLPKVCDWRWMLEREDTPWYPSFELIRQTRSQDWSGVAARAADRAAAKTGAGRR